ncbi:hypothetical protein C0993_005172, partial [Termitomyces sp. T159_Od127]
APAAPSFDEELEALLVEEELLVVSTAINVTTRYRPLGLSPGPGTPTLPKPLPQPLWAQTTT